MNILDIGIVIVVAGLAAAGYFRGLVRQLVSAAGLIAALTAAYFFYEEGAVWIRSLIPLEAVESYDRYRGVVEGLRLDTYFYNALSFLLIFWMTRIGLSIAGRVLHLITLVPGLGTINRWCGALLGAAEGLVLAVLTLHVLAILPSDPVQQAFGESRLADDVTGLLPAMTEMLTERWNQGSAK